jgi:hypothetical protein
VVTAWTRLLVLVLMHGLCMGLDVGSSRAEDAALAPPQTAIEAGRYRQAANLLDERLSVSVTPLVAHDHEKPRRRPFYARWHTYAGVAALSGAAGLSFALASRSNARQQSKLNAKGSADSASEARELEERGKRNVLLANVSFGAAGLGTIAAIFCAFRERRQEVTTLVLPMASRHRLGMSMRRAF